MTIYYLDIETTGIDPESDKIITIQFLPRNIESYNSLNMPETFSWGKLTILEEWESSEENIVKILHGLLIKKGVWDFIPFGTNLMFEFNFLFKKFKKYNLNCPEFLDWIYKKPFIDIRSTLLLCNDLSFKNSGLDKFSDKKIDGSQIPEWYKKKEYNKILDYIEKETDSFKNLVDKCLNEFPKIIKKKDEKKYYCRKCKKEISKEEYEALGICSNCED